MVTKTIQNNTDGGKMLTLGEVLCLATPQGDIMGKF